MLDLLLKVSRESCETMNVMPNALISAIGMRSSLVKEQSLVLKSLKHVFTVVREVDVLQVSSIERMNEGAMLSYFLTADNLNKLEFIEVFLNLLDER